MVWCGLAVTSVSTAVAQNAATSLDRYLRDSVGLDAGQMADVQRGHVVAKVLPADLSRDVAVFGIVAVRATRAAFESRLRDDQQAIAVRTQRFGIIGNPVRPGDVQPLSVDGSEYKDLRSCKPDDCNFKVLRLSGIISSRIRRGVRRTRVMSCIGRMTGFLICGRRSRSTTW